MKKIIFLAGVFSLCVQMNVAAMSEDEREFVVAQSCLGRGLAGLLQERPEIRESMVEFLYGYKSKIAVRVKDRDAGMEGIFCAEGADFCNVRLKFQGVVPVGDVDVMCKAGMEVVAGEPFTCYTKRYADVRAAIVMHVSVVQDLINNQRVK